MTRVAGERDSPGAFSFPLGEGVCKEEPKATRDFSGVTRLEEPRRGASRSSGAPTTVETRRDASSSLEHRSRAGKGRSALGDVRARIFAGARCGMRPPGRVSKRPKKKRLFSRTMGCLARVRVGFCCARKRRKTKTERLSQVFRGAVENIWRPWFVVRDFLIPVPLWHIFSKRFFLETRVTQESTRGNCGRSFGAVGWQLEPTQSRSAAAPPH